MQVLASWTKMDGKPFTIDIGYHDNDIQNWWAYLNLTIDNDVWILQYIGTCIATCYFKKKKNIYVSFANQN
jgi:hypothetical protein